MVAVCETGATEPQKRSRKKLFLHLTPYTRKELRICFLFFRGWLH